MSTRFFLSLFFLFSSVFNFSNGQSTYFQQEVNHVIKVKLDGENAFLHGEITTEYTNNSKEKLELIHYHIWPNAYKNTKTAFARQKFENGDLSFHNSSEEDRGYIDSLAFSVNGELAAFTIWKDFEDVGTLTLPEPLAPGESITISTPFRVKIPHTFSRMGHIDETFQITQWYPKPAVFDNKGWHPMPYLDQGEFYSEFGTFDVTIDVPKEFVVAATGDLSPNAPENAWLEKREELTKAFLQSEGEFEFPVETGERKQLNFTQKNIHDFAWFCGRKYLYLSDFVELESGSKVRVASIFNAEKSTNWSESTNYLKRAISSYSKWIGEYPYKHATAVEGALGAGGGMEYPNITIVTSSSSPRVLDEVITHEIGHNWFYGILGSNERINPWMDESINSYFEGKYMDENYSESISGSGPKILKMFSKDLSMSSLMNIAYEATAGENLDQSIDFPSQKYTNINYGIDVYFKGAKAFKMLNSYLGEERFLNCFKAYFDEWKFKHPNPSDIQKTFEESCGESLEWFFKDYLKGREKVDFSVSRVDGNVINLKNNSGIKLPVKVGLYDAEGNELSSFWTKPFAKEKQFQSSIPSFDHVIVNPDSDINEFRYKNNRYVPGKAFPKMPKTRISFGTKLGEPEIFDVGILPALGFNTTDLGLIGLIGFHGYAPKKNLEFHVMPMFSIGELDIAGSGGITYRLYPGKSHHKLEFKSRSSLFANRLRTKNFVQWHYRPNNLRSPHRGTLSANLYHLGFRSDEGKYQVKDYFKPVYGSINLLHSRETAKSSWKLNLENGVNIAEKMGRFLLSTSYTFNYRKKSKITVRGFGGYMVGSDQVSNSLKLGATDSGDPFGERILLDRNNKTKWLSNQILDDQGGFRSQLSNRYDRSLITLGGDLNLPTNFLRFISVFGDVGYGISRSTEGEFLADAGLKISLFKGVFNLNFPIYSSAFSEFEKDKIASIPSNFKDFRRNITFSFKFLDPFSLFLR